MKRTTTALIPALALMMGADARDTCAPGPPAPQPARICMHAAEAHIRPIDRRVADALIEASNSLDRGRRADVLTALATNPTICAETELRIISITRTLDRDTRRRVLVSLAGTTRLVQKKR